MTTFATRFISRAIFPLHERLKGHGTTRILRQLETTQWWPAERLAEFQAARLRSLIESASLQVPYYRQLFAEAGCGPQDIHSPEDLSKLPFLTKDRIRANLESLKANGAKRLIRFNTGGSTGEPLIFYLGKERVSHDVAAKWRATRWWGVDIGDPEVVVWGSPVELGAQNRLRAWRDRLLRTRLLSAFEMSEDNLNYFVAEIRRLRPKMLFGYPSALAHIARHAQKRGVPMNDLGIQVAFVTAERLYDDQRRCIEAEFGCQVANGYGGRDAGFVAHQCPAGSMHVTAEDMVVELIDREGKPVGAGEPGEVVVTHLATREFPFIRYRTGDVAVFDNQPCGCGRSLPVLKEVQGRTTDFVVASDGTVMHGLALIYVLRDLPGIESFKIIQENKTEVRVLVVPVSGYNRAIEEAIRRGFRARLGEGVCVNVEEVTEILPERSGKFRYVVSHMALDS
ncbi:capsular polysaccharide biosynthesis protein CapK [Nitrosococcus halophilus Nc 4]|uniref:Capsular polysaccharide biosynthesis protein CapK n=1 Tax=Nitrosococcus halophilus (strain Nc4) TaxID=472759 RepID=D5C033_NITHN|nr:AMP-binding protein [Nitrosococcus halophilus]ADE16280.1 capsular polysaccharide biosynthesis protein CapK [Nitrosococcus halophilus Nc 4]